MNKADAKDRLIEEMRENERLRAELERWKRTAAVEFDNRERAVAAGKKLEAEANAGKARTDAVLNECSGYISKNDPCSVCEVVRERNSLRAEVARLRRIEAAAEAWENVDINHVDLAASVANHILLGLGPDGKPVEVE